MKQPLAVLLVFVFLSTPLAGCFAEDAETTVETVESVWNFEITMLVQLMHGAMIALLLKAETSHIQLKEPTTALVCPHSNQPWVSLKQT